MVLPASCSRSNTRHDLDAGLRVEIPGRLVGEQNRGVVDERAGDRDALALAAGELVGPVVTRDVSSTFSSACLRALLRSFAGTPA